MWHATTSLSLRAPAVKSLKIFWLTIDALFFRRRRPSAPVKYQYAGMRYLKMMLSGTSTWHGSPLNVFAQSRWYKASTKPS